MEISHYKEVNKGSLICTFTLKIPKWGNFYLREMGYFKTQEKRWISFPSKPYEVDGKRKFFAYAGFEDHNLGDAFQKQVFKVLDEFIAKNSNQQPVAKEQSLFDEDIPF